MLSLPFTEIWPQAQLYDLANWNNGLAFRDIHFSPIGKPIIKIVELKQGITEQTKFTEQSFEHRYYVSPGDMLFSWSGNPDTSIDVFWWHGKEGWLNQHIFKVEPSNLVDRSFLFYLLKYLKPLFAEIARNKQTTGLGHVTIRDLKALKVGVPSLSEQCAISSILGALDDKIDLNRRMNETLEAIARALFTSWFVDFDPVRAKMEGRQPVGMDAETAALFPEGFEGAEMGDIPAGWAVRPLPTVVDINPTRSILRGSVAPYLEMSNMPTHSARALAWEDRLFTSGMKFTNGDVLVARITPCLENGKTAYVDFLADQEVGWGSTEYIVLHSKWPLPPEYVYFLARSDTFRTHAIQNMTGTSGRQRVPAECFNTFLMVTPSAPIAIRFGHLATATMAAMKGHDEESQTLGALRDALLPKLLSGEMQVGRAERELEAVL